MEMSPSLARLAAGLGAIVLSSCVVPTSEYSGYSSPGYYGSSYYGSGYGGGYGYDDFYYYGGGAYPSYYNRGYGGYTAGYSYYRGSSRCPICHHSPCSGHKGHSSSWKHSSGGSSSHYDHNKYDHRSSSRGSSSQSSNTTLYERSSGSPGKSQGTHSKEWFLSRGYSPQHIEKADDNKRDSGRSSRGNDSGDQKKSQDSGDSKKSHDSGGGRDDRKGR